MRNIAKWVYPLLCILFFVVGAYVWKIFHTGSMSDDVRKSSLAALSSGMGDERQILVIVEDQPITSADLAWEYRLHIDILTASNEENADDPSLVTAKGDKKKIAASAVVRVASEDAELEPLRQVLLSQLIERKVLFEFIKLDSSFEREDPARVTSCLKMWQNSLNSSPSKFPSEEDKQRLKSRLCEKSLIEQYVSEKVFKDIKISEEELKQYYESNKVRLAEPEKVLIQQILLPDERTARKVRARLRGNNFEALAKEFSIAPEASSGGQLGPFARGQLPDFFDVVFKMHRRQISDILKSPYGFHIIRLVNKYPARNPKLEEIREDVLEEMKLAKREEKYRDWVESALAVIRVNTPKTLW